MNKLTSKITKATAGVALMIAVVACNKGETKSSTNVDSMDSKTATSSSIVYVNSDSLLNNYQYFKELKTKFEGKSKKADADLKDKGAAFQREVAAYQQGANTMSADQRSQTEQRLARKQQELQVYQQNAGTALQNEEAQENEKLYDKVAQYLKKHAKENGYKMVLTYSKGNSAILFADESLDVTKEVIKGLNEAYKSEKK
ncbi:MAG: OmpH family outer membrane protein, partial [Bacteroidetes bacterium]|nr:OmpH family outer membrane protein [Bacteroidota bacterium]MBU1484625.1 OmpH family outer membrane protein [Bacteroidota bacterium]MBU2045550.1 OmpH family outer membrane protein [Bacteroidota bacterium]MBU2269097.1 OmpH family outer membrane protein [Bacteroidota bacterium]MBU2376019.1 OmpH family outer membrane protein [Bacteroidota bacterium]